MELSDQIKQSREIDVAALIDAFKLTPHPEGGYFRESYRSEESIPATALPGRFGGSRSFSTAIYFLIPEGKKSALHRIAADEMWHFYLGGPLVIVEIDASGGLRQTRLGRDFRQGETLQHLVPAGSWFGAYPADGSEFSFVGCTVAPGFDFEDFALADQAAILRAYPQHKAVIQRLTADERS